LKPSSRQARKNNKKALAKASAFFGGPSGTQVLRTLLACTQSVLRTFLLKTIINRFLNAKTLSGFESPHLICP
jgi:hypothetical protein